MNKKLSGSEFKKRAAKRLKAEQELLNKVPKIGSFFNTPTTAPNSTVSTCTSTSTNIENVSCHESEPANIISAASTGIGQGQSEPIISKQSICIENSNTVPENATSLSNEFLLEDPAT